MQSFVKFQRMVQEIQMKRAKRDILLYLLTDQPSHRISISWLKKKDRGFLCLYPERRKYVDRLIKELENSTQSSSIG